MKTYANEKEPPQKGNFALPTSQQPGPLVSIGQNIIDAKKTQFYLLADLFVGKNQHSADLMPNLLYAFSDTSSIFINVPLALSYQQNDYQSSGFEDASIQFEYAYFTKSNSDFSQMATILANMTFPTGSTEKQPTTGIGAPSFLLGTTYSRSYCEWLGFISSGAVITTSDNDTKFGNKYLYQLGIGRNISFEASSWILSGILEFDGTYTSKDKINGETNADSGGNVIYATPSLWFSTNKTILQFGVGYPLAQHLFGVQNKNNYLLVLSLGMTF